MNRLFFIVLNLGLLTCAFETGAQDFAVGTNAADYANLGTLNVSADYAFDRHWSIGAGIKYNPYTYRQQSYALNAKYWPWHSFSGWWISAGARWQEYNTAGWYVPDRKRTSEGDRIGGGLSGGYTYMLSRHFNLDIGAGFWTGYEKYVVYSCPKCGQILSSGTKVFILPSEIILGISYVF